MQSANRTAGRILERIETAGFTVRKMQMVTLSRAEAEGFYAVHREQPFFGNLTTFMSSGPVLVLVLEAHGAIKKWRDLMGATDPAQAASGTIRHEFGQSMSKMLRMVPMDLKQRCSKLAIFSWCRTDLTFTGLN